MLTSLQRIATGTARFWTFGVFLLLARDVWSITISPSPSATGNYTVTFAWTGCYWEPAAYYASYACRYLEERAGAGSWTLVPTAPGAVSLNVSGKATGTYTYQVYLTRFRGDKQVIDGPVSVTVGTPPPRDSLLTQLNYQFQTRHGDINADGRTDLFVKRTAGGVAGDGVLDATILRQGTSAGLFTAVVPTAYESSVASSWPLSSTGVALTDFNVDGFVDVEIKGVAAATGVPAAADQIVFSSGVPFQPQPLGVRAVDAALRNFVGNMLDYIVNPNYFTDYADMALFYGTYPVYYCSFSWGSYSGILEEYFSGLSCGVYSVYVSGYFWDYSGFSAEAVAIWTAEQSLAGGTLSSAQSTERAQQAAESALGVPIGGWPMEEELGAIGEHTAADVRRALETFWAILGIGRANAQEIETDEAPPQTPRQPGAIYITGRPVVPDIVAGYFPRGGHTALEFSPSFLPAVWVSAFPQLTWNGRKELRAMTMDNRDNPRLMMTFGEVTPGPYHTALSFWTEVIQTAHNHYRSSPPEEILPYYYWPAQSPQLDYNSNGYTHGLVDWCEWYGGSANYDFATRIVGGEQPVPLSIFH